MTEDAPVADANPEPSPKRWRLWIRRMALAVLALLGLVVVAVLLALTTSMGTGILLRQGAAIYSGMIPGTIEFEESEGALSDATTLRNLSVRDASGVRLIEADRLKLGVDLPQALGRTIDVGTIEIEGVLVDVGGNFADLGPTGPSEPTPPSAILGPDLPVEIRVTLDIRSVEVRNGPQSIAHVHKLDALVWGAGTAATLQLQTSAALPSADISVDGLTLAAEWDSPTLRVPGLLAQTSEGSLSVSGAYVDFEAEHLELGAVQARASTKHLAALVPGEPGGSATILLEGGGPFDSMLVEAFVHAPHIGSAVLVAEGGIGDVPWASVLLELGLEEAKTESGIRVPGLAVSFEAEAEGSLEVGIDAQVHARCVGCDRDLDPIELDATGRASPGATIVRLDADVTAAALTIHAGVRGSALLGGGAALSLRIPALAEFSPVIDRFAPGLGLKGAVRIDATCGALLDPAVAICRATGGVEHGAPVQQAGFDVSVGMGGDRFAALVHSLRIDQGPARIRMGPEPARILYTPELLSAHDVRARFGTTEGLGTLVLDGELGLTDSRQIAASTRVSGLPLHSLKALIPSLDVGGVLSSSVEVGGTLSAPTLAADVRGWGLRYESVNIGDLGLDATYSGESLDAALDVDGGDLGTIDLDARLPILLDVQNGKYEVIERRRSSVSLRIADANLEVARLAGPKLSSLRGRLDLTLEQTGSLARPQINLEAALREGAFEKQTLPEVNVRLQYAGQTAEATVVATHPEAFDRVEFSASAPVALNILRGAAKLRAGAPVVADLVLTNVDLAYARRLDERVAAKGLVSMNAKLRGDPAAPQLDVTLDANALSWQDQAVGDISLALGYDNKMAVARLWASGPEVSGIGVDASVPVTLDLAATSAKWHSERPHDVQVAVNELMVRPTLARIPGAPSLDLDARVDAVFELHGSAVRPTLSLHSEVEDIVYGGREAGDAILEANYGQARAHAEVSWDAPQGRTAWVSADAPLALDLPNRSAQWDQSGEHHVRVSVPKLDRFLLEPFVDAGEFEGAVAVHAILDGSLEAFDGSLSARGFVGGRGHKLPLDARIVVAPTEQSVSVDLGSSVHVRAATKAIVAELMNGGDWKATEVEATADIDSLRTSDFSPFLPNEVQNLRGLLEAHVTVGGRLGKPELEGSLALNEGAVTVVPARVRLTDLQVASSFSNQGLALKSLSFKAGDGTVSASGAIDVAPNEGLRANLDVIVKKFPLRAPGLPRMALSTRVRAKGFASLEKFDVNVGVGKTNVDVYATSISAADAIPSNSNVVLADLSRPETVPLETSDKADAPPIPKHLKIDFGDDINIIGPSINMRWAGNLETNVGKDGAATSGKLNAKKGTFSLLGNEFDLEKGDVYLSDDGSAMPFLDVTANTSVEDVVISVAIRGPAAHPEFELSSVPTLPQSEIFTILVTGTSDTQGADSEEVQDKAAGILAAMSNSALQRQIGQKLRVDKIGVGFGDSTDQPILSVGKNVTKNVYAETEYHHNAPKGENTAQLEVEYEFAPRWSLQTFFGDAAEGGIAVFWGFAFDTKPRPKKADEAVK